MGSSLGPGCVIAGRYRLAAQLGQGGMGSVWSAEHLALRSPVAVKLIDPEIAGRADTLERFQAEAQAAATLRSPHVVQILDYGVDDHVPYIVMEMLDGESLADRLRRVGRLPYAETARFVTHVARALSRAHEAAIVHRDLKPDNVFLVRNDDQDLAKVLDFGIAKTAKPGVPSGKGPTRTGSILGTPSYMSPEQAQGIKSIDARSDLWSLGVIVFECVVGRAPFESEAFGESLLKICAYPLPVPSQLAGVPDGFDEWFARACCREVSDRFQTAKELAEALRAVLVPDGGHDGVSISGPVMLPPPAARTSAPSLANTLPAPGTTVPGMSLATAAGSRQKAGAYLAVALGIALAAGTATWLGIHRYRERLAAAASSAPRPSATEAAGAAPPPTEHVAATAAPPPAPTVAPASSALEPTPSASARPRGGAHKDSTHAPPDPAHAPTDPAHAPTDSAHAPPPPGPSARDQRLGF